MLINDDLALDRLISSVGLQTIIIRCRHFLLFSLTIDVRLKISIRL